VRASEFIPLFSLFLSHRAPHRPPARTAPHTNARRGGKEGPEFLFSFVAVRFVCRRRGRRRGGGGLTSFHLPNERERDTTYV